MQMNGHMITLKFFLHAYHRCPFYEDTSNISLFKKVLDQHNYFINKGNYKFSMEFC